LNTLLKRHVNKAKLCDSEQRGATLSINYSMSVKMEHMAQLNNLNGLGWDTERRLLPMEMLERVFMFLPPKDLKTVMLVCKRWNEVASVPKLWTWVVFKPGHSPHHDYDYTRRYGRGNGQDVGTDVELCLKMISLPRLQAVREIQLHGSDYGIKLTEPLLLKAQSHPGLKKLVIHECDVRTIGPKLLASFFSKMEEVDISDIKMSFVQSEAFYSVFEKTGKIKILSWQDKSYRTRDLSKICLIATKKVEKLTLKLELSLYWLQELFKALQEEDTSVKSLSIDSCSRVNQIGPVLMSEAVARLEEADLEGWNLTIAQWTGICNAIKSGSKLKKLLVPRNNLGEVECTVFSGILQHLVELDLESTSLRAVQSEAIMLSVAASPGKLKKLILQGNDLEQVDATVIARAVTKIESLNIAQTELSSKQAEEIFKAIAPSPGVLKNLNMDSNDLKEVDPKVMADAVNKLEKVCFSDMPFLTQSQMTMILIQAVEKGTSLKELTICPERRALSVFHADQVCSALKTEGAPRPGLIVSMYNKLFPLHKLNFPQPVLSKGSNLPVSVTTLQNSKENYQLF